MSCTRYLLRERSFHRVRADRMATGRQSLRSRATRAAWDRHSHRVRQAFSLCTISIERERLRHPSLPVLIYPTAGGCYNQADRIGIASLRVSSSLMNLEAFWLVYYGSLVSRSGIIWIIRAAKGGGLYLIISATD